MEGVAAWGVTVAQHMLMLEPVGTLYHMLTVRHGSGPEANVTKR